MQKVIQMSQRQISENGEEKSMSLQEVFLVNHSLSQAKEKERMITVTSGLICSGPYMRSGPIGSLVRTLLASSRWYSPARRLKWEVSPLYSEMSEPVFKRRQQYVVETICRDLEREGYPSSRYLYRLVPSELPTAGTGYGLLPTVTAQDYKRRGPNSRQQGLPEMIHEILLPTPLATEIHHRKGSQMETGPCSTLHSQLKGEKKPNGLSDFLDFYGMLLPTPVASDAGVGAVRGKRQDHSDTERKGEKDQSERPCLECRAWEDGGASAHSDSEGLEGRGKPGKSGEERPDTGKEQPARFLRPDWKEFPAESPVCSRDDGLPPTGRYLLFSVKTGIH